MKHIFILILFILPFSVNAGMQWVAIMVEPTALKKLSSNEDHLLESLYNSKKNTRLDLDKSWHGIHFLLNNNAWETTNTQGKSILGGKEFGSNLGYGPAKFHSVQEVKIINRALNKTNPGIISTNYNPENMEKLGIYPPGIWKNEGDEALKYLISNYQLLRKFYERAASKEMIVIIALL